MKYTGEDLREISFPLGGIGTGSVGLCGDGRFQDWEIFNRPAKGSINGYSHFAIRAIQGDKITAAVLNGDITKDYMGQYERNTMFNGYGFGPRAHKMCGFPHFRDVTFDGKFPTAVICFRDESFPAGVRMTAFNPFIPLDAKNSSIPAAFFEIEVNNTTKEMIQYQIALSVANPYKNSHNVSGEANGYKMISLYSSGADAGDPGYGDLTIATDCDMVYRQTDWYRGRWQDSISSFWNEFSGERTIKDRTYDCDGKYDTGSLIASIDVRPGEAKSARFVLSWNVPNCYNYWSTSKDETIRRPWKNYYATVFKNSAESACYALENWDDLYRRTLRFQNALHGATLPREVIEASTANLSVLKSPTVLRLEDGSFYGWEGVMETTGSCEGTCQHVWNYAYALCFLFPKLERSIRDVEFKYSTDENGKMGFRVMLPLGSEMTKFRACLDGQMGAVIKCYREWKISGDHQWLRDKWDSIKKVLEYAWNENNPDRWDRDKDGVLEGRQHHTLDMELFGPSSWLEGMYLAALKAAAEMGDFLGDRKKAAEYRELFEKGYRWTRENLFNGKYFIQKIDLSDKSIVDSFEASEDYWNNETKQLKYQIENGSAIDQMLAQWHADIIGLGDIYDREQISAALSEMMKLNYKPSMRDVVNYWRIFALDDEAGSIIYAYPEGEEKPKIPLPYSEETMTGFEYSFAGLLCSRGRIEDGLKVVRGVRDRFDGKKRNPWNEFECGSNYARSMASYALIPILSGFEFDMPRKHIGFHPYQTDSFRCVWSLADAWGSFEIEGDTVTLRIYEGVITLRSFGIKFCHGISDLRIDGKPVKFEFRNGQALFEETGISECIIITR